MKHKIIKHGKAFIIGAVIIILSAAGLFTWDNFIDEKDTSHLETVSLYFLNPITNEIEPEQRGIAKGEQLVMLQDVLAEFIMGPESETLSKAYPEGLGIDVVLVSPVSGSEYNKTVEITFPDQYYSLSQADEIILRACLTYTLTGLDFVKNVDFLVSDPENPSLKKVLLRSNSLPLSRANRENLLISPSITSDKITRKYALLYFPNSELTGLVGEPRMIDVPSDTLEERIIVNQIAKGPTTEGLANLWPADLHIVDIKVDNKVCYVDLSGHISPDSDAGTLLRYSIINSLAMPDVNVKRVQFLVNGEKATPESQPVEKDESLILEAAQVD